MDSKNVSKQETHQEISGKVELLSHFVLHISKTVTQDKQIGVDP